MTEIEDISHQWKEIELKWQDALEDWNDEVAEIFGQVVMNPLGEAIGQLVMRLTEESTQ